MSVNSITNLSTALASIQTNQQIGIAVLKQSINASDNSVSALLGTVTPPQAANLPPNLGRIINTQA